jgi:PD-(D/E)XK nuclease superfamily protein
MTVATERAFLEVGQRPAGPRNAATDPRTGLRYYTWQGRKLPSVTTIRRLAGLPWGLHEWALGQVATFAIDHSTEIHARLSSGTPGVAAVLRHELRAAATAERDRAADLGSAVHEAAAAGKALTDVSADIAPRLRQYQAWLAESRAEILGSEFQLWNLTVGYAGSADLLCRFPDGSIWVVDLKTGKGVYPEHVLQLVPYLMAEFIGADDQKDERLTALLHQAKGVALLHLTAESWEFRSLEATPAAWAAFRGLLAFGSWIAAHPDIDSVSLGTRKGAG